MIWTGWSRLIWHNFVKVADNWIKICRLAQVGTLNRHVKFGWKIPNRFGKIAASPQGGIFFDFSAYHLRQESCPISKMTAQCAPYMGTLRIFGTPSWLRLRLLFSNKFHVFFLIDSMNVRTKFKVRSFTCSWDNKGYSKNGSPWICPRSLFSKILREFYRAASVLH